MIEFKTEINKQEVSVVFRYSPLEVIKKETDRIELLWVKNSSLLDMLYFITDNEREVLKEKSLSYYKNGF